MVVLRQVPVYVERLVEVPVERVVEVERIVERIVEVPSPAKETIVFKETPIYVQVEKVV